MDADLADLLACPQHREPVAAAQPGSIRMRCGCAFPLLDGIPLMLGERERPGPGELQQLLAQDTAAQLATAAGRLPVDPVVARVVPDTNGTAYRLQRDRLSRYPVPPLRFGPGRGRLLLDVGCGWGRWTFAAQRLGYAAVGVDLSCTLVLAARRAARQLGSPVRFVIGDARRLPFRTASFQAAHSYSVVQHFSLDDADLILGEVARVLADDGECQVQLAHRAGLRSLYQLALRGFGGGTGFNVRYWTLARMKQEASRHFRSHRLDIDCFFGLGLQPADRDLMGPVGRIAVSASEALKRASRPLPGLLRIADSILLQARK